MSSASILNLSETITTADVHELLANSGLESVLARRPAVVVKPNLCFLTPRPGVTTSPAFMRALLTAVLEYTPRVTVVESDSGFGAWTADEAFRGHGIDKFAHELGVGLINLSRERTRLCTTVVGGREVSVELAHTLLDADCFITVPVPKVHAMTGVSLGLKNQWGCIGSSARYRLHPNFDRVIVAINSILRPQIALFDGEYFLDRTGPIRGTPVRRRLAIASSLAFGEPLLCHLMGVQPGEISHLRHAIDNGLIHASVVRECGALIAELQHKMYWRWNLPEWIAQQVFRSTSGTWLCYDSPLAPPLRAVVKLLRSREGIAAASVFPNASECTALQWTPPQKRG